MKGKFTYKKLIRIRRELAGFMVPIGTVPTNPFPSKEELDRWNALPRWVENQVGKDRRVLAVRLSWNARCPRCERSMTRQQNGGLRCGRNDCHIST